MTLLKIDGSPIPSALSPEEKQHHPERVMRRRELLEKTLSEYMDRWRMDNAQAPNGSTTPNEAAIDRHFDGRWREECRMANSGNEAVIADAERMANWIKEQRDRERRERLWTMPFHQIGALDEFTLRLVGRAKEGEVWINSHIGLQVWSNGRVLVFQSTTSARWRFLLQWLSDEKQGYNIHVLVDAIDYTPKELFALLGAMRIDKVTHPIEADMEEARLQSQHG